MTNKYIPFILAGLVSTSALAQMDSNSTASSGSMSGAVSSSHGGTAHGGTSAAYSGAASAGNAQIINFNSESPNGTVNTSRVRTSGTTRVENTPDTNIFVPGPTVPCFATYGGSVSVPGFGIGLGGGMVDEDCSAREDARTLVSIGLQQEAVNRLCQRPDMAKALGSRCPKETTTYRGDFGRFSNREPAQPVRGATVPTAVAATVTRDRSSVNPFTVGMPGQ
jgi:hypothetical protein